VLAAIMKWVESEAQDDFMIDQLVLGNQPLRRKLQSYPLKGVYSLPHFFFSRTSSTRNAKDRLIPTLAYQRAINPDPVIFKKNIEIQIDTLLIQPLHSTSTQTIPLPQLVIIDATNVTIV